MLTDDNGLFPMGALNELKTYVHQLPRGPVLKVAVVQTLLEKCWLLLRISDVSSKAGYKLQRWVLRGGRTEGLLWTPPHLTFDIVRHGGVAMGGKVAEVYSWEVNVEDGTAIGFGGKKSAIKRLKKALNVEELAKELASLIGQGAEDHRLKWTDDHVRVIPNEAILKKGLAKATLEGRRRRFNKAMVQEMSDLGWEQVPKKAPNTYRRTAPYLW